MQQLLLVEALKEYACLAYLYMVVRHIFIDTSQSKLTWIDFIRDHFGLVFWNQEEFVHLKWLIISSDKKK